MKFSIGFDLGGTKLAAALVREDGEILDFAKVPVEMKKDKSPKHTQIRIVNLMADLAVGFREKFPEPCRKLAGVGLASAGPMNVETGQLIYPVNFPGWKIVPIQKMLESALQKSSFRSRVYFQNDAMAAALCERWIGGAQGLKSFAVVTVGTGVGSGVVLNGQPCQNQGAGSEFGHLLIDLQNLKKYPARQAEMTVEGIASGTGLLRRAKELGFRGNSIEELVLEKNKKYQVLYDDMAWALAILCYNLSVGCNLDAIFLSGGLIKIKQLYLPQVKEHYRMLIRQFNPLFEAPIQIAKTKNLAGVLGAASLSFSNSK